MWLALVVGVISLLLVSVMPKPNVEQARAAKLGDFQIARSNYGDPLPLVWGTVRQKSPIILWFGDFRPVPITKKVSAGLFSTKKYVTGYKNYIGMDCLLCIGPDVTLRRFWAGSSLVWSGAVSQQTDIKIDQPNLFGGDDQRGGLSGTMTFYEGNISPPRDAYLASVLDPNVPAYNGFARVLFKNFYIGTTTTLESFTFEVSRLTKGLSSDYSVMPNGLDVNPFEVTYDLITQKRGRFGNLPSVLNLPSFVACAKTVYDEGLGMSLAAQSTVTGKDLLEEIMRHVDGILYQDPATSEVVAKLIRQDYDVSTLPILDESVIKELSGFSKTTWDNTFNQCRVTFKDRASDYDDSVATSQDFANINYQQRVKSTEISAPGAATSEVANILAARQLSMVSVPLYKCDITCNRTASTLRPGDCFIMNWSPYGLQNMVMRVSKIDLGELTSGAVKISCVQDRFATATPTFAPPAVSGWTPFSTNANPVSKRNMLLPPHFLARASLDEAISTFETASRFYILASAPSSASIGFDAYSSKNNFADDPLLEIEGAPYNGSGSLAVAYPATTAAATRLDTSGTMRVTGISSYELSQLKNYTTIDQARDGSAMMLIGSELFVYVGFTDNGDGSVTFKNVYRSVLDTIPGDHAVGDDVWFISGQDGLIPTLFALNDVGYLKLLDTTPSDKLALSAAPIVFNTQNGRARLPYQPQNLMINGSRTPATIVGAATATISWANRSRSNQNLQVFNDADGGIEANVQTRIRWRVGSGAYTTVMSSGTSLSINIDGLTGVLEVLADSLSSANGLYSQNPERLTVDTGVAPMTTNITFENGMPTGLEDATAQGWTIVDKTDGTMTKALRAKAITDSQTTATSFNIEVTDAGQNFAIRFLTDSELNFDFFQVFIDDATTPIVKASGPAGTSFSVSATNLAVGTHKVTLQYSKDSSTSVGTDTVYISKISHN